MRTRRTLKDMTAPVAAAFVVLTVLALVFRVVSTVVGLVAEFSERIADASDAACAVARGPVLVTDAGSAREGFTARRAAGGGAR